MHRSSESMFFVLQSYGALRDLHSFPTRRSSDLPASGSRFASAALRMAGMAGGSRRTAGLAADESARANRRVVGTSRDRKSTRLNSSHVASSYAVFCLKKKNNTTVMTIEMYLITN